jgi:hypothetical protein
VFVLSVLYAILYEKAVVVLLLILFVLLLIQLWMTRLSDCTVVDVAFPYLVGLEKKSLCTDNYKAGRRNKEYIYLIRVRAFAISDRSRDLFSLCAVFL